MTHMVKILCGALLMLSALSSTSYSAQIGTNSNNSSETVSSLKKKGFKCSFITQGFTECRKGKTIYYCSGSVFELKKVGAADRRFRPLFNQGAGKIVN